MIDSRLLSGGDVSVDHSVFRADVLLSGRKIARVGGHLDADSHGATVIDATGMTILPGLIDAHAHVAVGDDSITDAQLAIEAVGNARAILTAGTTSVRDVGGSRHVDIALRDAIADDKAVGPFMECALVPIVTTPGATRICSIE